MVVVYGGWKFKRKKKEKVGKKGSIIVTQQLVESRHVILSLLGLQLVVQIMRLSKTFRRR